MGEINPHTSDTSRSCDIKDNSVEIWFKDSLREYSPIGSDNDNESFNDDSLILKEIAQPPLTKYNQSKLDLYKSKVYGVFGYQTMQDYTTNKESKKSLTTSASLRPSSQLTFKERNQRNSKTALAKFNRSSTEQLWNKSTNSFLKPSYTLKKKGSTALLRIDNFISSLSKCFKHTTKYPYRTTNI